MFHDVNCMLMGEKQHFYIFYKKKSKLQRQLGSCSEWQRASLPYNQLPWSILSSSQTFQVRLTKPLYYLAIKHIQINFPWKAHGQWRFSLKSCKLSCSFCFLIHCSVRCSNDGCMGQHVSGRSSGKYVCSSPNWSKPENLTTPPPPPSLPLLWTQASFLRICFTCFQLVPPDHPRTQLSPQESLPVTTRTISVP